MKELRKQFRKKGTDFTQLYKDNNLVVYQLSRPYADSNGKSVWYEVFRYRTGGMNPINPNYDPNEIVERYPSDEDFGVWAWSCSNIESIKKALNAKFGFTVEQITAFLASCGLL